MQLSQIPSVEIDDREQRCRNQVRTKATPRQLEVLGLFGNGLSPQEVAQKLEISVRTVDTHKTKLLALCRNEWGIPTGKKINYFFLQKKFANVELNIEELRYCDQVIAKATRCQLKVLKQFGEDSTPQEVAQKLGICIKTVDTHKTKLLALCRSVWGIPCNEWLDYRFLNAKFADFSSHE